MILREHYCQFCNFMCSTRRVNEYQSFIFEFRVETWCLWRHKPLFFFFAILPDLLIQIFLSALCHVSWFLRTWCITLPPANNHDGFGRRRQRVVTSRELVRKPQSGVATGIAFCVFSSLYTPSVFSSREWRLCYCEAIIYYYKKNCVSP